MVSLKVHKTVYFLHFTCIFTQSYYSRVDDLDSLDDSESNTDEEEPKKKIKTT